MEKLSWSHSDLRSEFGENTSLSELVSQMEKRFQAQKKVICRVTVNGMELDEAEEAKFSASLVREIQTLDIELSGITDLVSETLQSSMEYAKVLTDHAIATSQFMRLGDLFEAHTEFRKLIEGVDSLILAQDLIAQVLGESGQDVEGVRANQRQFLNLLSAILESYKRSDFILTADQLEYELSNTLDQTVTTLGEILENRSGSKSNSKGTA